MADNKDDNILIHTLHKEVKEYHNLTDGLVGTLMNVVNGSEFNESSRANETDYLPYDKRVETYLVPVLFLIIFVIGVLGNGCLIYIFIRNRNMRNVPNMYICSLAIGDILVVFFCVPFTSTVYTVDSWPYGLVVCKFSEFIKDVSIGVSVFTLTALSADRYFAISDPMRKVQGRRATRITTITIIGIWVFAICFALPSVIYSYVRVVKTEYSTFFVCYPYPPELTNRYPKIIVMLKFLVFYAIPLLLIAYFYILMARDLVLSTRMPGESQGQAKQIQARKKVAKMVLSFVVIFAVCFFPSHVFMLWFYYDPNAEEDYNEFWHAVRILGFCLSFINSCINPITLYCLSGTFRKHFNQYLFCCWFRKRTRKSFGPRRSSYYTGSVSGYYQGSRNNNGTSVFRASTITTMSVHGGKARNSLARYSSFSQSRHLQRIQQQRDRLSPDSPQVDRHEDIEMGSTLNELHEYPSSTNKELTCESPDLISLSHSQQSNMSNSQYFPLIDRQTNDIVEEDEDSAKQNIKMTSLF